MNDFGFIFQAILDPLGTCVRLDVCGEEGLACLRVCGDVVVRKEEKDKELRSFLCPFNSCCSVWIRRSKSSFELGAWYRQERSNSDTVLVISLYSLRLIL